MLEYILFYGFGGLAIITALIVILNRNPIYSALALIGTLFSLAMLYLMQHAHFVGFVQIMVYAGAIMVLFLFVIQLLDQREESHAFLRNRWSLLLGLAAVFFIAGLLIQTATVVQPAGKAMPASFGTIEAIGLALFRDYLLPFELISVLLLAAITGAVVLAKRRI